MNFGSLDLNTTWFILIGVLFTGYAMLDGFDLGVGALHLFTKKDEERRIMLNAIGPVWDGNEVWLVTGGGALFAAFPNVYATVFSGFYLCVPHMAARMRANPWLFSIALVNMLAIANIPREIHHGRDGRAFLSSCVAMIALMGLFGLVSY